MWGTGFRYSFPSAVRHAHALSPFRPIWMLGNDYFLAEKSAIARDIGGAGSPILARAATECRPGGVVFDHRS